MGWLSAMSRGECGGGSAAHTVNHWRHRVQLGLKVTNESPGSDLARSDLSVAGLLSWAFVTRF